MILGQQCSNSVETVLIESLQLRLPAHKEDAFSESIASPMPFDSWITAEVIAIP